MRLDAHQHFWAYDPIQYPWIPKNSALHRDWLPEDLGKLQAPLGFEGSIAVQARQSLEESRWLLALADAAPAIKGVVGWVDLRANTVDSQLAEFAAHPKFVGVRHVVQDEPDPQFLLGTEFMRGIAQLEPLDLAYDLLIFPHQLRAAIELVAHFPTQRFVLDHIAKPSIKDQSLEPWQTLIGELAQAQNVTCKVSGMITEADHLNWQPDDFKPYLDRIFAVFGQGRLMFGSDWPVCLLAGSYEQVVSLADLYAQQFSAADQASLFGGNAQRVYRL